MKIGQAKKSEESAEVVEQNKDTAEVILEMGDKELTVEALLCASDVNINLERRIMLEREVQAMDLLSAEVELSTSPLKSNEENKRTRKTWRQRISEQVCDWDNCKEEFYQSYFSSHAFVKKQMQQMLC